MLPLKRRQPAAAPIGEANVRPRTELAFFYGGCDALQRELGLPAVVSDSSLCGDDTTPQHGPERSAALLADR
jgi:hypothetical protein